MSKETIRETHLLENEDKWKTYYGRKKTRKTRRDLRSKVLAPYFAETDLKIPHFIDIPALFNLWPDVITEIVKHVGNDDLLELKSSCVCVSICCKQEIQSRMEKKSWGRRRRYYKNNKKFNWKNEDVVCDLYYSYGVHEGLIHHPWCDCFHRYADDYYDYGYYDHSSGLYIYDYMPIDPSNRRRDDDDNSHIIVKNHDEILILETESDVLLNPKIRFGLLNYKGKV